MLYIPNMCFDVLVENLNTCTIIVGLSASKLEQVPKCFC